jgi:hypothetical protein
MIQNQPVMKRIIRNLLLILMACSIPLSMAFGQEKKNEKKIKVTVDEGSGAKIVLDTVIIGTSHPEVIKLKDGNLIFIGEPGTGHKHVSEGKKVIVSVEADDNDNRHLEEDVFVMSSDSANWTVSSAGGTGHVYVYSHDKGTGNKMDEWEGEKVMIIKDGKITEKYGESEDAAKYVIAKDGVVVTVESDDEAKATEIIQMVESKLSVKSGDEAKKEVVKTEKK